MFEGFQLDVYMSIVNSMAMNSTVISGHHATLVKLDTHKMACHFWQGPSYILDTKHLLTNFVEQLPYVYTMFPATTAATAAQNVARRRILVSFVFANKFC